MKLNEKQLESVQGAYARLKKDLTILQAKYELFNKGSFSFLMADPEYKGFLELLHIVHGLGDLLRSQKPRERRKADYDVFWDERKG